jgi:hypothetical protein
MPLSSSTGFSVLLILILSYYDGAATLLSRLRTNPLLLLHELDHQALTHRR